MECSPPTSFVMDYIAWKTIQFAAGIRKIIVRRRRLEAWRYSNFSPRLMQLSLLTAALQELTPRAAAGRRSRCCNRRVAAIRPRHRQPATSSFRPRCIRARPMFRRRPCSIRSPTRSICASRSPQARAARVGRGHEAHRRGPVRPRLFRQHAGRGCGRPGAQEGIHAAGVRCRGTARYAGGLRLRRPQSRYRDGSPISRCSSPSSSRCCWKPRRAGWYSAWSTVPCPVGTPPTSGTTISPTRRAPGLRCIASASGTVSAISSAFTTIRHTPFSWARTAARSSNI